MSLSHHPNIVRNGLVAYFDAANPKSYPAGQDSYANNVSLLLDGESLTDKSQNNFTVTNSSVAVSSAEVKYGTSSLYFNGASYLSIPDSTAFGFGTGDFTIEFWLKLGAAITATSGDASFRSIVNKYSAGSNGTEDAFYVFLNNAAGTMQFNVGFVSNTIGSNFAFNITGVDTSLNSVWNHVAVVRSSGSLKVYFNGTQIGTTQAYSSSINQGTLPLLVGARTYAPIDLYFNGYIDDLRITKAARYTANFTPPIAPFSLPGRITNLTTNKGVGSFIGSDISYSSTNAGTVTLGGSNGYGVLPNTLTIGPTSTFTLCAWVNYISRPTGGVARRSVLDQSVNTNDFEPILGFPYTYSASKMGLEVGKAGVASQIAYSANTNNLDQWYYLTGLFKNGSADFYINGVYQSSVTYSATVNSATANSKNWGIGGVFFNGTIVGPYANCKVGPIQVYNRNLASGEIFQNYNATKSRYGY
jgi:hypothetical protein